MYFEAALQVKPVGRNKYKWTSNNDGKDEQLHSWLLAKVCQWISPNTHRLHVHGETANTRRKFFWYPNGGCNFDLGEICRWLRNSFTESAYYMWSENFSINPAMDLFVTVKLMAPTNSYFCECDLLITVVQWRSLTKCHYFPLFLFFRFKKIAMESPFIAYSYISAQVICY